MSSLLQAQSSVIDSLQRIVALHSGDSAEVDALLKLTDEFLRKDFDKSKEYAHQVIKLANSLPAPYGLSPAYLYLITLHQNSGRPDSALYYLNLTKLLAEAHPSNKKIIANYNHSASLFYKHQGEFKKALPFMLENLSNLKEENESKAGQLLNIGNLYFNMGSFKDAADYHLKGLRLFEKLQNKRGQSFCLQSLGNDLSSLKQYADAEKYYQRSIELKKELGDKRGIINSAIGLGDVSKELERFNQSEKFYLLALRISREMKLAIDEATAHAQLGLLYKRMGDIPKARDYLTKSLRLIQQAGDSTRSAKIKSDLIGLDLLEQNEKVTETALLTGLSTIIQSGDRQQEAIEYFRLNEFYALKKQYEKAYYYLQKYQSLSDSVEGNAILLQLKEMEEKYNSEKKEKEIELLKKDQELQAVELKRQRANTSVIIIVLISVVIISVLLINRYRVMNRIRRQTEMESMRQQISRDLHDDIGSTLSSINIMSQLAMKETGDSTQLKKIAAYSSSMMESMSDMVWSINPRNDSLEQMVVKMKEFAAEILEPKNIQYNFEVDPRLNTIKLNAEKRKNLFLIFKEAINNAAKYSEATYIEIQIASQNSSLTLLVTDNGKGFDRKNVVPGNGLKNMMDRAHIMKGSWQQHSEPGKGTSISVQMHLT